MSEEEIFNKYVSNMITEKRILLGLTQDAIASKIGEDIEDYRKIETSELETDAYSLYKICDMLEIDFAGIFNNFIPTTNK